MQDRDPSDPRERGGLLDQFTGAAEMLSLVLLAVPFGCMTALLLVHFVQPADYIFLPGPLLRLTLPAAGFVLLVQLVRILRRRPADRFSRFMLAFGLLGIPAGVFAWLLAGLV